MFSVLHRKVGIVFSLSKTIISDFWTQSDLTHTDVLNDSFVCYQDFSEYVVLLRIELGFHGEPALKTHYKTTTSSSAKTRDNKAIKCFIRKDSCSQYL